MSLRKLFLGLDHPHASCGWGNMAGIAHLGAKQEKKKKSNGAPKSTLTPLLIGNRAMRSPLGMFVFNFDQKVDVTPPPTPLFRGQNQFFLGDVFIFVSIFLTCLTAVADERRFVLLFSGRLYSKID